MSETKGSANSLLEANRYRAKFSGHGAALGAAGFRVASHHPKNCSFLENPGDHLFITPEVDNFHSFMIGAAWDNAPQPSRAWIKRVLGIKSRRKVDLDLGCLYELSDGTRGAIQAFGNKFGAFEEPPFIRLSGDARSGKKPGHDEYMLVNADQWQAIKRMIIYIYIYDGAPSWSVIKPQVVVDVPGQNDFYVTLNHHKDNLPICTLAGIEYAKGGIKLTNYTEYFSGHEEMDRAFGFGLNWADGKKE